MTEALELAPSWISLTLTQLGHASIVGALAFLVAWLLARTLGRRSARVRAWIWRIAFLKLMIALFVVSTLDLPVLARPPVPDKGPVPAELPPGSTINQAAPVFAPAQAIGWPAALLALWLAGAVVGAARVRRGWLRSRRLRAVARPVADGPLSAILAEVARELELGEPPAIALIAEGEGPMLVGFRRPTVLLPEKLAASSPADLKLILAHELAHFVRADLLWSLLAVVAEVLFFFHPLVRLAARELALDHEIAADELAIGTAGASLRGYGELLLSFVTVAGRGAPEPLVAMHAGSSAHLLKRRLGHLHAAGGRPARSRAGLVVVGVVGLALLLPLRLVRRPPTGMGPTASMAIKGVRFQSIGETLAFNSGVFNVLISPTLSDRLVNVNLRDVDAFEALQQVARGVDAQVVEVPYVTGQSMFLVLPAGAPAPSRMFRRRLTATASMAVADADALVVLETLAINAGANFVVGTGTKPVYISIKIQDLNVSEAMNAVCDVAGYQLIEEVNSDGRLTFLIKPRG